MCREQPRETRGGAQLSRLRMLLARTFDRGAEGLLDWRGIRCVLSPREDQKWLSRSILHRVYVKLLNHVVPVDPGSWLL